MGWFRKNFWQIFGIVVAITAIIAAYNIYNLQKPRKELQVIIDPAISLVDVKQEVVQDIQINYKGEPVNNVFLVQVHIKNTGNQAISETDFVRPLSFTFSQEYQIADASIVSSIPGNIGMSITKTSEQRAEVSETMLNPEDYITLSLVIIGEKNNKMLENLSIDGRILGVKAIQRISTPEKMNPSLFDILQFIGIILTLSIVLLDFIFKANGKYKEPELKEK